jgi:predicted nucleic acid-binding protein
VSLLLDTNVVSEVQRPAPDLKVLGWLDAVDEDRVFISVASIAELRRGIALMDDGRRRASLAAWLANDLPTRFAGRILPIDHAVAEHWGGLMAQSRRSGVALSVMDGFFAATALATRLTLVTRNVKDFTPFDVPLFSPWDE